MSAMLEKAIESNIDKDVVLRLLEREDQGDREKRKGDFHKALLKFQSKCPAINKSQIVRDKGGGVRYRFAPLDEMIEIVRPVMNECGLSYEFDTNYNMDTRELVATCTISNGSWSKSSSFPVPIDPDAFMNDAQKRASADSFAKRYAFMNALGIVPASEDDDGKSIGQGINAQDIYKKSSTHMGAVLDNIETVLAIKDALANNDLSRASEAWHELDKETMQRLWLAPSKGGCFTTDERATMKSTEFHEAHYGRADSDDPKEAA